MNLLFRYNRVMSRVDLAICKNNGMCKVHLRIRPIRYIIMLHSVCCAIGNISFDQPTITNSLYIFVYSFNEKKYRYMFYFEYL